MKMLSFIYLFVFNLIISYANDEWVSINGTLKENYLVKVSSIKKSNNYIKIWIKQSPVDTEARNKLIKEYLQIYPVNYKYRKYAYSMYLYGVKCNEDKLAILAATDYDEDDNVIYSASYYDLIEFRDAVPESGGEAILNYVCTHIPK